MVQKSKIIFLPMYPIFFASSRKQDYYLFCLIIYIRSPALQTFNVHLYNVLCKRFTDLLYLFEQHKLFCSFIWFESTVYNTFIGKFICAIIFPTVDRLLRGRVVIMPKYFNLPQFLCMSQVRSFWPLFVLFIFHL